MAEEKPVADIQTSTIRSFLRHQRLHLIGNAHIDPVWLWRWNEGFSEVKATFQSAVDRLKEYPDFIFTCAGACYYQWVEQNCPELFAEIRHYVQEGRWVPVNGWWIQPDCNLPCGESFARQSLYGQRYYLEKFGRICHTGYNVDSFGHHAMLPQILRKSGMSRYVFMRPNETEKPGVPLLFQWESADGSQVLTSRLPSGYGHKDPDTLPDKLAEVSRLGTQLPADMMFFYGVGNHGGGPTITLLDKITRLQADLGADRLVFSDPDQYMADLENGKVNLPIVSGDLHHHAVGCYSANLQIKKMNRQAENRLIGAECLDSLAASLFGGPDNRAYRAHTAEIKAAWTKVMFNQFHDILCGCSIKPAYQDAAELHGCALAAAGEVQNQAMQKISWAVDTLGEWAIVRSKEQDWRLWGVQAKGTPVVVFNTLPFEITAPLAINGDLAAVKDSENRSLPIQRIRGWYVNGEHDKWQTLTQTRLPALGYATLWLHQSGTAAAPHVADRPDGQPVTVAPDGSCMGNGLTEICFDPANGLVDLFDRTSGRHLLKGPAAVGLVIDEAHSDTWGHGLREYRDVIGSFQNESIEVLERGPVRGVIRLTGRYRESVLIQDFMIYQDRSDIEVQVKIRWLEKHRMLKIEFPTNIGQGRAIAEIPFGFADRPADGTENPIHRWIDYSNESAGLAIINDSNYAADVKDGAIRLTILRSPAYADHFGRREDLADFMEQGISEIRYQIVPHIGNWQTADLVRKGMAFNFPPTVIYETYHHGVLPQILSGLAPLPQNIIAAALKIGEDHEGYILRAYESAGKATRAEISLPTLNRCWSADFGPCEIKTFLIPFEAGAGIREVNLLELEPC